MTDLADADLDLLVIGGGIIGAGVALQAVQRVFVSAWSRLATLPPGPAVVPAKMIHRGFRYLAEGEIGLVREALQERAA